MVDVEGKYRSRYCCIFCTGPLWDDRSRDYATLQPLGGWIVIAAEIIASGALIIGRGFPYNQIRLRPDEVSKDKWLSDDRRKTIVRSGKGIAVAVSGIVAFIGGIFAIMDHFLKH